MTPPPETIDRDVFARRLVIFAFFAALLAFVLAVAHRLDRSVDETMPLGFAAAHAFVAGQIGVLMMAGCVIAVPIVRRSGWVGYAVAAVLSFAVPVWLLLDAICFHLIGERLGSAMAIAMLWTMLPHLIQYIPVGSYRTGGAVAVGAAVAFWTFDRIAAWGARRWCNDRPVADRPGDVGPATAAMVLALSAAAGLIPAAVDWRATTAAMAEHSSRHPWCALGLVPHRGVGPRPPTGAASLPIRLAGLRLGQRAAEQLGRYQTLDWSAKRATSVDPPPDVLLVVIESLQLSMVDPQTMPHTAALADRGYWLRNHFTGGNSTPPGMFSLVTGKEAVWFNAAADVPVALNRFFKAQGYRLGFFAGVDSYSNFEMDDFIQPEIYDEFLAPVTRYIETDREAVEAAEAFLQPGPPDQPPREPRLAVVYLYSSHSPFDYIEGQEYFRPVSPRQFAVPFGPHSRPPIWNRYRNSVRSMDQLLSPLLTPDRVIAIVGDHGEALLEDGSVGHGTRLDHIQCQTPAVLQLPGYPPRAIDQPTSHVDILPTVIAACGFRWDDESFFDGEDLTTVSDRRLADRPVVSRHYTKPEMLITHAGLGAGGLDESEEPLFGYRVGFDAAAWAVTPLGAVNRRGLHVDGEAGPMLDRWLTERFGLTVQAMQPIESSIDSTVIAYLTDPRWRVRELALAIAAEIDRPSAELIAAVSRCTYDADERVKRIAREIWPTLQRRALGSTARPNAS